MSIPMNDSLAKPYDDDKMKYDYDLHQYVLDIDYAMYQTGLGDLVVDMQSNENVEWYMTWISRVTYDYIRSFKDSKFYNRLDYYLSHSKQMRVAIERIMLDILFYSEQEGGLFMAYITGINLQEAQNITTIKLKTAVGLIADQIVMNYGLKEKEFRYDFDVIESTTGLEW